MLRKRIEIGDKVAVLDDVLKGRVVEIDGGNITVETLDGMIYRFDKSELIVIEVDQHELTKYSDINNSLLKEKIHQNQNKKSLFKKQKNEIILEVDLHINKLTKSTRNMDNYDMLNLQLDVAKKKIDYAVSKRISKIVFIHGVGEGVLKSELVRLLKKYNVKFYDASYKKYGLGATEVYVYQNHV
ncbi:Smr/MutS family protein [Polaribacter sargassicola]|uniref:Smr/MutS family protein n=1 Tax=Polaribacter sargassicola TaxID=2836891 RepID=UPI001F3D450C|nr:Smr/MutS family protein [Polaribacter sp. DS7-9]MCG1037756.1 DNA mismatch repair protein MutS [Polaribacter sp. DS7-9]